MPTRAEYLELRQYNKAWIGFSAARAGQGAVAGKGGGDQLSNP
jgi:hypothetical protein